MTRRVKTLIKLGIRSVSLSDRSPRCQHEETLGPYLPIAKLCRVSLQNIAECLGEMSLTFSAEKTLCEMSDLVSFSAKKKYFVQVVYRGEKRALFLG